MLFEFGCGISTVLLKIRLSVQNIMRELAYCSETCHIPCQIKMLACHNASVSCSLWLSPFVD